jgi:hypothetical protein
MTNIFCSDKRNKQLQIVNREVYFTFAQNNFLWHKQTYLVLN